MVWVYDDDHRRHPFVKIGIDELVRWGCDVTVIDRGSHAGKRSYRIRGIPRLHALEQAVGRWFDKAFHRLKRQEERAQGASQWEMSGAKSRRARLAKLDRKRRGPRPRWNVADWVERKGLAWSLWLSESRHDRLRKKVDRLSRQRVRIADMKRTSNSFFVGALGGVAMAARVLFTSRRSTVVVSGPGSLTPVSLACLLTNRRIVYYPFELYGCQNNQPSPWTMFVERTLLRYRTVRLITQNDERASIYRERGFRGEISIVRNFKPERSAAPVGQMRSTLDIPADTRIVVYEGMLIGGRWLDRLCQAALLLPDDVVVVLVGRLNKWWKAESMQFAQEAIAARRLFVHGEVKHERLLDFVAGADAGVVIYDDSSLNNLYCAPGKLSDYIFAEVPVVASGFPTLKPMVEGHRIGSCFDSGRPEDIADAIMRVLETDKETWRDHLRSVKGDFAWPNEAPNFMKGVFGSPDCTDREVPAQTQEI